MRAKSKKNNLIALGLILLLILIGLNQQGIFIGAAQQPTVEDLEKLIKRGQVAIADAMPAINKEIAKLEFDIKDWGGFPSFGLGNDTRRQALALLIYVRLPLVGVSDLKGPEAKKIIDQLQKDNPRINFQRYRHVEHVLAYLKTHLEAIKQGKIKFDNTKIKADTDYIKQQIVNVNTNLDSLKKEFGKSMKLETVQDLATAQAEIMILINQLDGFRNGIQKITDQEMEQLQQLLNSLIGRYQMLIEEGRRLDSEKEKLKGGNKGSFINSINLLAQVGMKQSPGTKADPKDVLRAKIERQKALNQAQELANAKKRKDLEAMKKQVRPPTVTPAPAPTPTPTPTPMPTPAPAPMPDPDIVSDLAGKGKITIKYIVPCEGGVCTITACSEKNCFTPIKDVPGDIIADWIDGNGAALEKYLKDKLGNYTLVPFGEETLSKEEDLKQKAAELDAKIAAMEKTYTDLIKSIIKFAIVNEEGIGLSEESLQKLFDAYKQTLKK